jgi:peptidoglycan/xylan/chitin deacetylase (PgdA/CDA1 family)
VLDVNTNPPYTVRRLSYDDRKGRSLWPHGARMAMLFYTCPEEYEWDRHETISPPGTVAPAGEGRPSLSTRTAIEYGFHVGLPRILDIAERHGIRLTLGATGNAAKRHARILRRFLEAGHEIAAHGYSQGMPQSVMTYEEQAVDIDSTIVAIADAVGYHPVGWWGPAAACTEGTIRLLAERKMLFHGDLQDDELPYFIDCGGHTLIEIPYNMTANVNDIYMFAMPYRQPVEAQVHYLTSTFDAYYLQAADTPLYMVYGTHPYITGHPEGAYALSRLIAHAKAHEDVWIATYREVAEWWKSQRAAI